MNNNQILTDELIIKKATFKKGDFAQVVKNKDSRGQSTHWFKIDEIVKCVGVPSVCHDENGNPNYPFPYNRFANKDDIQWELSEDEIRHTNKKYK